jgi:hypothetical protein
MVQINKHCPFPTCHEDCHELSWESPGEGLWAAWFFASSQSVLHLNLHRALSVKESQTIKVSLFLRKYL